MLGRSSLSRWLFASVLLTACSGPGSERGLHGTSGDRPRKVATRPRNIPQAAEWFEKGRALEAQGQHGEAIDAFARALEADELHGLAYLHKAENHLLLDHDPQIPRILLKEALDLLPDNPRVHLRYGDAAIRLGHDEEAEAHWRRAMELRPDLAEPYLQLARYYEERQQLEKAVSAMQAATKADPNNVQARVVLADLLGRLGKHQAAAKEMEAVAEQTSRSAPLYRRAADYYELASLEADAERLRAIADTLDPPPDQRKMRDLPAAKPPPPDKKR